MFIGLIVLFATLHVTVKGQYEYTDNPTHFSIVCSNLHCPVSFGEACLNPTFIKQSECAEGCTPYWNNQTQDPARLEYQNCTTKCSLTYQSDIGDKFMSCAMEHNCITFEKLNVTCPTPKVDIKASLAMLEGEWWQHWGFNKLWDCYPCQHIHKMELIDNETFCKQTVGPDGPVQAPCWSYTYSYDLYLEEGTQYFQQTWQLPSGDEGIPIAIWYTYLGTLHNETWYMEAATDNYVILVDCSYMQGWTNVGSIVWVKPNHELTDHEMSEIASVYKERLGWNYPDDFCKDITGPDNCDSGNRNGFGKKLMIENNE